MTIENSTIKNNGRNGIELYANTVVYNNTIKDNQKDGINITKNSVRYTAQIRFNTINKKEYRPVVLKAEYPIYDRLENL